MAEGQELITQSQEPILTPAEVVTNATTQAKLLMDIVGKTKCFQVISGKKYLQVEAWETIGAFNRTHAETKEIKPIIRENEVIGYESHVQLWRDGIVIGGAIMPCYFTENCCKGKDGDAKHKASMSAAQTFATSKAYRMNYSYVAILAGYQPLPAEEITDDMAGDPKEHWCPIHETPFFKRGKMTAYGHPIKDEDGNDTGEWCHEHKENPETQEGIQPEPMNPKTTPDAERIPTGKKIQNITELKGLMAKHKVGTREAYEILSINSFTELTDLDEAWGKIKAAKKIE